ncbi:serine O-acetyltransferase EpsC [Niabella ginsengisoli]|uniref:Serine acetyltransferase n=1 Tax=Niabella ginsengisoli TaxID=522298 RepID=A0ABS9SQH0_9BACT|nr:serine O-acetyltransferase EpsC [Niabella ginsengisoli]MCH5600364.1 serine acetyltransferase [Niabella ginsengisoli]
MSEDFIKSLFERNSRCFSGFPDKGAVESFIDELYTVLFLPNDIDHKCEAQLREQFVSLKDKFSTLLRDVIQEEERIKNISEHYFEALPGIYHMLLKDAEALLQSDPAAKSLEEVMAAYPGFYATAVYRLSHLIHRYNIPVLARLFSEYAHSKTGIDIHPGATIGHSFSIDHGTGVVIGETSLIGNHVKIYQGVTLGALSVVKELATTKRHPTIEDNVVIYSGATILGGNTVIGKDSIIGGNVWLTNSVPHNSVVYHKSEISVKDLLPPDDSILNFVI